MEVCPRSRGSAQAVVFFAHLAQSVEHTLGKGEVAGSIPVVGTSFSEGGPVEKYTGSLIKSE